MWSAAVGDSHQPETAVKADRTTSVVGSCAVWWDWPQQSFDAGRRRRCSSHFHHYTFDLCTAFAITVGATPACSDIFIWDSVIAPFVLVLASVVIVLYPVRNWRVGTMSRCGWKQDTYSSFATHICPCSLLRFMKICLLTISRHTVSVHADGLVILVHDVHTTYLWSLVFCARYYIILGPQYQAYATVPS